ncbi:CLUMA_CG019794, isoform A [Clunio marinus]|uniref:aralkylamine N-acetyltransferase n=1 Tax=Clunio marinus TaxID=568069 RepID=A0A1J1J213_9DIPT|nr:CLUMA_CG019794, isoform A [Clunio marinus]
MSSGIEIRAAKDNERGKVLEFLERNFFNEEPINKSYPSDDHSVEGEFLLSCLSHGNIILAIDSFNNQIAGLACFGEITKFYAQEGWDESEITTNRTWRDILKFMSHIEMKANVCERFAVPKALHLHCVTADKKYRGKGIGKLLFNECFKVAKSRHLHLVSADCTSIYSIHIAEILGMECVSTVTYDEYHEKLGYEIFKPIPPHFEIKTFIKRI